MRTASDLLNRASSGPVSLNAQRALWRAENRIEARTGPCFRVTAAAAPREADVFVYDIIGGWDLDSAEFVRAVKAADVDVINMHINSPGGFVWDAVAMHAALVNHKATVKGNVDGLAASAASFLAMASDTGELAIEKPARMMIHDAQGVGIGAAADMREYADLLDEVSDTIAGMYADRAGGKPTAWRARMLETTWYGSAEAVKAGLADRVANDRAAAPAPAEDRATQLVRARARAHGLRG